MTGWKNIIIFSREFLIEKGRLQPPTSSFLRKKNKLVLKRKYFPC